MPSNVTCSVLGCERAADARGWCQAHWRRWRQSGDLHIDIPIRHKRLCSVPACDRLQKIRGWCAGHERRFRVTGDVQAGKPWRSGPHIPAEERFWSKVDASGDCWEWRGFRQFRYGRFHLPGRQTVVAHRFAYEILLGPNPVGMEIDHLCRNRGCVNPDHLEAVTAKENTRRSLGYRAACRWPLRRQTERRDPSCRAYLI